jgi:hypothetical protein
MDRAPASGREGALCLVMAFRPHVRAAYDLAPILSFPVLEIPGFQKSAQQ